MPRNASNLTVLAPAKVNLHLAVLDRRPDGFHNIESVFLAVDYADTLHFEQIEGENGVEIVMEQGSVPIPPEKNIIFHALSLFRAKTGFSKSLKIRVEKRIPIGGGLGGGSSDAAAALLALNNLAENPLTSDLLLEMGESLGSDVPFFLHKTAAALVTGRGEKIEALLPPRLFLTLVNPGFSSDTAAAFKLLDKKREGKAFVPPKPVRDTAFDDYKNDFLPVFEDPESSTYNEIIFDLKAHGAEYANLSGSGSTCFGVFQDKAQAEQSAKALRNKWKFSEFCCSYGDSQCERNK